MCTGWPGQSTALPSSRGSDAHCRGGDRTHHPEERALHTAIPAASVLSCPCTPLSLTLGLSSCALPSCEAQPVGWT